MSLKLDMNLNIGLTLLQRVLISERICTYEAGSNEYPITEARYPTIENWERETGRNFFQEFSILYRAGHGTE